MKSLLTLIRLQKQKVDELRKRIGALERQRQQWLNRSEEMARQLRREQELAGMQPEMSAFFGGFAERIKQRQEEIAQAVKKLDKQMDELAAQVRAVFAELKKYELMRDRRLAEQRERTAKREAEFIDEVALNQHRRKE